MVDSSISPSWMANEPFCRKACPSWRGVPNRRELYDPDKCVCFKTGYLIFLGDPCVPALRRDRADAWQLVAAMEGKTTTEFEKGARAYAVWRARCGPGTIWHAMKMVDKFIDIKRVE